MKAGPHGTCSLVLHGHLPWVHHPDEPDFLEEDWYFEALAETYLPLIRILDGLAEDEVPVRLAVGLTPPLLRMFGAPALRKKAQGWLASKLALARLESRRLRESPDLHLVARHYELRFRSLLETWERLEGDPVRAFAAHQDAGRLEILASCATHAILPLLATERGRRQQVRVGTARYRELFGRDPLGFWLPECGYAPGIDDLLAEEGILYTILETHGVSAATPAPPAGCHRPITLPSGVLAFARDPTSSRQVWSSEVGYPGDPAYREFYRDLGYDGDYDTIRPWLHADGVRRHLGLKYHRVTGRVDLSEKAIWDPPAARARADEHARHFLESRASQAADLAREFGEAPSITSPYDMELFGHWWYEGPWFLEALFRRQADPATRQAIRLATPADVARAPGSRPAAQAAVSTWGEGGYFKVWLDASNAWLHRHQRELDADAAPPAGPAPARTAPCAGLRLVLHPARRNRRLLRLEAGARARRTLPAHRGRPGRSGDARRELARERRERGRDLSA